MRSRNGDLKIVPVLAILWMMGTGAALAHAHLKAASPAQDRVLQKAPLEIRLAFTEAVQTRMSVFKVYPLALTPAPTDTRVAAATLLGSVLTARGDQAARADTGLTTSSATSETVTLGMKPGLKPGVYVVMWKVMAADDGHVSQGNYTFTYAGPAVYACPRHPEVMSDRSGGTCPKCGSKLVPARPSP